jgi:hypothetical protein
MFVIPSESGSEDKFNEEGTYKNFQMCCDDLIGPDMIKSLKLLLKLGGMSKLLSDYTNRTLTEFEKNLFLHVLVK